MPKQAFVIRITRSRIPRTIPLTTLYTSRSPYVTVKRSFHLNRLSETIVAADGILQWSRLRKPIRPQHPVQQLGPSERIKGTSDHLIQTPIIFTEDYSELVNPVMHSQSLRKSGPSSKAHPRPKSSMSSRLKESASVSSKAKRGLNAFSNTALDNLLTDQGITHIVLAEPVTSICIWTQPEEPPMNEAGVTVLSDCYCVLRAKWSRISW